MTKKQALWSKAPGMRMLTRRNALALGAAAATSLYLPNSMIRSARAQTASFDYYIGPNGSDSNPGTQSQPWAITAINTKRSTYAGKRVGLLDGTYGLIDIMGQPGGEFDAGILLIAGGSAGSPTVVQSVNPRGAILDWQISKQTNTSQGSTFSPYGDYVTIDGIVFANNNYRCIAAENSTAASNVTIQNCLFTNQSYSINGGLSANSCTIYTQGGNNWLISNCRFEGGGAPIDSDRHAVIQCYKTTDTITVEYCTAIGNAPPLNRTGPFFYAKNGYCKNITIRYCYYEVYYPLDVFYYGWGDNDATSVTSLHHNIFYRKTSTGASYVLQDSTEGGGIIGTWTFYNNTFVGPDDQSAYGGLTYLYRGPPTQVNYYGNIIQRGVSPGGHGDLDLPAISTLGNFDYNLYDSNPTSVFRYNSGGANASGLSTWQSVSGKDAHSIAVSDPLFVATGTEAAYFQLQSGSPGKALGEGGQDVGAWSGTNQVGCSFDGGTVLVSPDPPKIISVS